LRRHLLRIGEVTAHGAELAAVDRRLEILDLGAERREVEGRPAVEELGLQPQFKMVDRFGLHGAGVEIDCVVGVERQAVLVDAQRLEALGIGRIGKDVGRDLVIHVEVVSEVPGAVGRRALLRLIHAALRRQHGTRRGCRGAGNDIARAVRDDALIKARLLVIIDPRPRLDRQRVGHLPAQLSEQRRAGALEILRVGGGQTVEDARIGSLGPGQAPAAGIGTLLFGALRIDPLFEAEQADDEIDLVAFVIVSELLTILILLRRVLRFRDDRQAGEVAIILGLPVPEAPGGDRGEGAGSDVPFHPRRNAADLVTGVEAGVDVGQTVEHIAAGNGIGPRRIGSIIRRDQPVILACKGALRPADADQRRAIAFRVLFAVIRRQRDAKVFAGLEQ